MSFILDALKKSERERAMGVVPTLNSVYTVDYRPPFWPRLIAALVALAVLAGVGVMLLHADFGPSPGPVASRRPAAHEAVPAPVKPASAIATPMSAPAAAEAKPANPPDVSNSAPVAVAASTPATQGPPPPLSALPASVQEALPPMTLNVVSYSKNPAHRFVMINLARYVEGNVVAGGATIKHITADGVIMEYHGTRFMLRP